MKRTLIAVTTILFISCSKGDSGQISTSGSPTSTSTSCGTYNGHTLYKGAQGGCYYKNSNGTKVYVDRSKCRC